MVLLYRFFVPQISQIYTDFSWDVFLVTQISQMTQIFSSDDTEFIRRFPAATIIHGISQMRPVRSLQIPPEIGQRDSIKKSVEICEICGTKKQRKRRTKTTISSWFSNEYRNHATVLALRLTLKVAPNLHTLPVSSPT